MNTFIRLLYSILIAAAVVSFVGVAIYTFYPGPKEPTYVMPEPPTKEPRPAPTISTEQPSYQKRFDSYQADSQSYQRTVSGMLAAVSVAVIALGLWLRSRTEIIGEGTALGGIGTSIYAIMAANGANDRIMRFVAVTLFLTGAIVFVYRKFNENTSEPLAKR